MAETSAGRNVTPRAAARLWFGAQAVAGAAWWVTVFASDAVAEATLGTWDPVLLVGPDLVLFVGTAGLAALTGRRWFGAITAAWTVGVTVALVATALSTGRAGWGAVAMSAASVGGVLAALVLWVGRVPLEQVFVGPFAFREAESRSPARQVRRSLGQLVVFWSTFLIAVPLVLAWAERRIGLRWEALGEPPWRWVGAAVFVGASAIGLWSCLTMAILGDGTPLPAATARRLVIAGPYRWVRNPMAVAGALQTAGVGLWLGSWLVLVIALAGCIAWDRAIRPTEEADLLARFGPPYDRYRRAVRCWVPRRGGLREEADR